jgi:hypothetical protein
MSDSATLDLADNDLIVQTVPQLKDSVLATVNKLVKSGRAGGAWSGTGITSSKAAGDTRKITGLAVILNEKSGSDPPEPIYPSFDGELIDNNAILVKFDYNGDTDGNGRIDADDYFNADRGFAAKANPSTPYKGYQNGDFDFTGSPDADDYFLLDTAFSKQGAPVAQAAPKKIAADRNRIRRARHHVRH